MNARLASGHDPSLDAGTPGGTVHYRHAGGLHAAQATHVLLHGIGSASASWVAQLHTAVGRADCSVLAWDAPGYGDSTALQPAHPTAQDYAERLWDWLDALKVSAPITLVQDAAGQPGFVARAPVYRTGARLDTLEQRRAALVERIELGGRTWLWYKSFPITVGLIRATAADPQGAPATSGPFFEIYAELRGLERPAMVAEGDFKLPEKYKKVDKLPGDAGK